MERDANDDDHCSFPTDVRNHVSVLATARIKNVHNTFQAMCLQSFLWY